MLPVSMVPFAAYGNGTPEGRLLRDRVVVAVAPPDLPDLEPRALEAIQAVAPRYEDGVMALVYHGLGDVGGGSDAGEGEGGDYSIPPRLFGEHLVALRAAGLVAVTAADVAAARQAGAPLPANAVMISFDDGRSDAMLWADPLLEQAGVAATMFVITSAADTRGAYYASWDELRGYADSGRWDLQAHTDDLHRMQVTADGELPALTSVADRETIADFTTRVATDLERSSDRIAEQIGTRPVAFAYPFGAHGGDRTNDDRVRAIVEREVDARYALAFHQDEQEDVPLVDCGHDPLQLRRLDVRRWTGLELVEQIAAAAARSTPAPCP